MVLASANLDREAAGTGKPFQNQEHLMACLQLGGIESVVYSPFGFMRAGATRTPATQDGEVTRERIKPLQLT